uniref:Coronin n=1 Tax=Romanomermis culicivorax TaxID=13658 RepID=A0A915KSB1_ROMCU
VRITGSAHDSQFCAVNPKFIAVVLEVAGGGAFQVLPLKWTGKVDYHTGRVSGHNGVVNDLKWNPFNDNIIASCSDDTKIKLWYIPDGGVRLFLNSALSVLAGHSRRVLYLEWHPTVEGILSSAGGDCKVCLWNVNKAECFIKIDCHEDLVYSLAFDPFGTLLATTCKDRYLRIFDARTGEILQEAFCHEGTKASKVIFLGEKKKVLTTGFNRMSHRQIAIWNQNDISTPLLVQEIDTAPGVLFPFYDSDLSLLYIAGKGDGNIRYYEILESTPHLAFLSEFQSKFPQKGLGLMPKRGLDVSKCEIFRFYKIHASQTLVEPLSFIVPRKSERFQTDLYPPTPGPTPALTVNEWLCGVNKGPVRISLQGNFSPATNKPVQVKMAFDDDGHEAKPTLITSDLNNERKFQFLSEITKPDYRDITKRDDYSDLIKLQQARINISRLNKYVDYM